MIAHVWHQTEGYIPQFSFTIFKTFFQEFFFWLSQGEICKTISEDVMDNLHNKLKVELGKKNEIFCYS